MILRSSFASKVLLILIFQIPLWSNEPFFVVLICSYNNEHLVADNLESVSIQTYKNYRIIYVDDSSTDKTSEKVNEFCSSHVNLPMTLITNECRKYKLANMYLTINELCNDNEIIVELDGDDCFLTPQVLETLRKVYSSTDTWMTYGGFVTWPHHYKHLKTSPIPEAIINSNDFRNFYKTGYIFMALRSFYAWLFKSIEKEDLQENGCFFTCGSDIATMIPMFEMAGDRFYYLTEPVYLYNTATGINDFMRHPKGQKEVSSLVQKKPPYKKLTQRPPLERQTQNLFL